MRVRFFSLKKKATLVACIVFGVYASPVISNKVDYMEATEMTTESKLKPIYRSKGKGKDYAWGKDHIFVKLSNAETGGALTLIQDNLKKGFNLGLHLHHKHTEIFYILQGEVDFTVAGRAIKATTGAVIYIPEGTPHAAKSSTGAQMLMFYIPGGFDNMLSEIENASWLKRYSPFASARRNKKYDMNKLKGEISTTQASRMRYLEPGKGLISEEDTGSSVLKLSSTDTNGLATVFEQNLKSGAEREVQQTQDGQSEILYVLEGKVEFVIDDKLNEAESGSTIYFPTGTSATVKSSNGAKLLVFRMLGDSE